MIITSPPATIIVEVIVTNSVKHHHLVITQYTEKTAMVVLTVANGEIRVLLNYWLLLVKLW
jgi:hypothetical protein